MKIFKASHTPNGDIMTKTRAERFVEQFNAANPTSAMDAHAILAEYGFTPIPGGRILFEDGSTAEMLPATMLSLIHI